VRGKYSSEGVFKWTEVEHQGDPGIPMTSRTAEVPGQLLARFFYMAIQAVARRRRKKLLYGFLRGISLYARDGLAICDKLCA